MKRIFTYLFLIFSLAALPATAQEVDMSYVFMDEDGEIIDNGSTVVRNVISVDDAGSEIINSGISVFNLGGSSSDYLKVHYVIERIDNGTYQICFPTNCNMQTKAGTYETGMGQLMADLQDIQSEWFPAADGECVVKLTIEIFSREGMFPPTYIHEAWGPTITVRFVKGAIDEPVYGDVTGDGEVNIVDVNFIISRILDPSSDVLAADANKDGEVNINDINTVIAVILNNN